MMAAVVLGVASATEDQINIDLTVTYTRNNMGRVTVERNFVLTLLLARGGKDTRKMI